MLRLPAGGAQEPSSGRKRATVYCWGVVSPGPAASASTVGANPAAQAPGRWRLRVSKHFPPMASQIKTWKKAKKHRWESGDGGPDRVPCCRSSQLLAPQNMGWLGPWVLLNRMIYYDLLFKIDQSICLSFLGRFNLYHPLPMSKLSTFAGCHPHWWSNPTFIVGLISHCLIVRFPFASICC